MGCGGCLMGFTAARFVPSQSTRPCRHSSRTKFLTRTRTPISTIAPLEERRARAVQMRRVLPEAVLQEVGRLDQDGHCTGPRRSAPRRSRQRRVARCPANAGRAVPEQVADGDWQDAITNWTPFVAGSFWRAGAWYAQSIPPKPTKACCRAPDEDRSTSILRCIGARHQDFTLIFPGATFEVTPPELPSSTATREDALLAMITGWMMHCGPVTSDALAFWLGLLTTEVEQTLLRLEASGSILRGNFTGLAKANEPGSAEWCDRRLLARIHHLTVATLRKQVEPVTAAQYMWWLLRWQHVTPESQLAGERGLLEAVRQLQGFEIPANAWEKHILAARVNNYDPAALDRLCLTGAVGWGRLSPHPATLEDAGEGRRRVVPTSVAPITFFVRDDSDWMQPRLGSEEQSFDRVLGESARGVLEFLRRRGASFFADIVRGTERLKAEIETALWGTSGCRDGNCRTALKTCAR